MARHSRLYLFCAWMIILSLVGGPLTSAGAAVQPIRRAPAIAQQLPDDPAGAARMLVEQIYGPDEQAAHEAITEVLRRAAVPVVSIDGPVVALPDYLVLADAAVYAELIPDLTRAVRAGDFYTVEQMGELLLEIGISDQPIAPETIVGGLGRWGKRDGAPVESAFAGAVTRALSGRRLQVLYPGADMAQVQFDPLQTVLILAHASTDARTVAAAPTSSLLDRLSGVKVVYAQAKGPCDDLEKVLAPPSGQIEETITKVVKEEIINSWKDFALNDAAKEALGKAGAVHEKGTAVLNVLLLLMGAQIDVVDNKGGQTHFKHAEGDRSKHVEVHALAYFDSNIAKKKVACYKLAGVDVPPPGPLSGFKVRWSLNQAQGVGYQGKYLTAVTSDSQKIGGCGTCGETTGSDGRSKIELYPPVEKNPGKGYELTGGVRVTASLDKADFPFKLSDLLGLKNPGGFAAGKIWDLAVSAISRAGLPSKSIGIQVKYHGSEIYVSKGKSNLWLFYITAPVELDLYTCEGLNGKWYASGGMGGDEQTFFGDAAETVFGVDIPEGVTYLQDTTFLINPNAVENRFDLVPEIKMTGVIKLDRALIAANRAVVVGSRVGRVVGEVDLQMDAMSLAPVAFFGSTTYPLYQVPEDPRCPPGEYYFENYP